ncbi:MAG: 50S ribosomal protein L11 methyltransferase [Rhizobiales bacterium]|nr:50S ribosomal protein L11 methyltransferase [Hyphomicrobiales bacterium]
MTAEARTTLTFASAPLEEAQGLADRIDEHPAIDALAVTVNETDEVRGLWNVVAYFPDDESATAARNAIKLPAEIAPVPQVDWVRKSLEGLAPVAAGRFFLHGSHDRERRRGGGHALEIDAGTAFGTGHHGTTAGCLLALDAILKSTTPRNIFDLGCGTGVLAIAAALATRRPVLATDIDPEAVRVTIENARINALRPLTRAQTAAGLHHPVIGRKAPYDLIFANILARPLAALAQGLSRLLAPGGHLILSGLTREQLRWIKACYLSRGLTHSRTIFMGNWVALVMTRPNRVGQTAKRPGSGPGRLQITSRAPGWELDA